MMLAALGFVVMLAVLGLAYLALIMGRPIRLHFSLRSIKVEIDQPELPPGDKTNRPRRTTTRVNLAHAGHRFPDSVCIHGPGTGPTRRFARSQVGGGVASLLAAQEQRRLRTAALWSVE